MNLFLRAKHWQLFTLTIGIGILFNLAEILSTFFNFDNSFGGISFNDDKYFTVTTLVVFGPILGWIYSVGVGMQKMAPATAKKKVTIFKVLFFIPIIYLLLLFFLTDLSPKASGDPFFGPYAWIIVPIHLFSMFCMFYCLYFAAKTIKTVELQRAVTFSDFMQEFILAWFFPIGIWILQPRINKMTKLYANSENVIAE